MAVPRSRGGDLNAPDPTTGPVNPIGGDPDQVAVLGNWCDNLGHELLDLSTALSKITVDEFW
ncbi:MAG: hypothetical protein HOW97_34725, partial [Catenulispora sp.]|nr:hypothetical protein [Catenulispora sp.]